MEHLDGVLYKTTEIVVGKAFYSVGILAVFTSSVACGVVLSSVRLFVNFFIVGLSVNPCRHQCVCKFA